MNFSYRKGTKDEIQDLKELAIKSWSPFQEQLTAEHFDALSSRISSDLTYEELIDTSTCFVCVADNGALVGMAFLVPNGNPTDIYLTEWSYIRFVSVDPDFGGQGIGRKLTTLCIDLAKENGEKTIALHTGEMMDKARHIYESLGFEILHEIDRRLGKQYWLYTLELDGKQ